MTNYSLEMPINNLSFGQVSTAILRELYNRSEIHPVFTIGNVDLGTQKQDPAFNAWLNGCINSAQQRHQRGSPVIRLWHIGGSLTSLSTLSNDLVTFFELDQLTPTETNVLKQQRKVYVTSRYTQKTFSEFGIKSEYLPIGFDGFNFAPLAQRPRIDGVTQALLAGKLEARKGHLQVLAAWAKRYGNRKEYRLNCAVHNPFMRPEDQNALIGQALQGKQYWNINWLPWSGTNAEYNSVLQSSEIIISCSGGEGRDLPCYHATAMGAWPIALSAHAYLDYLTDENAVLINPNGKRPAADGVFFQPNALLNNGSLYTFSDDDFLAAFEVAEKRAKAGINTKGLELQKLTYKETVDTLVAGLST